AVADVDVAGGGQHEVHRADALEAVDVAQVQVGGAAAVADGGDVGAAGGEGDAVEALRGPGGGAVVNEAGEPAGGVAHGQRAAGGDAAARVGIDRQRAGDDRGPAGVVVGRAEGQPADPALDHHAAAGDHAGDAHPAAALADVEVAQADQVDRQSQSL